MRVLVSGSRNYSDAARAFAILDHYHGLRPFAVLIEGEASGLDTIAKSWAQARGVPVEPYPARWTDLDAKPLVLRYRRDGTPYNAAAGGIRNQRMLDEGRPNVALISPAVTGPITCAGARSTTSRRSPMLC